MTHAGVLSGNVVSCHSRVNLLGESASQHVHHDDQCDARSRKDSGCAANDPTSTVDTAVEANVDATYPVSQRPSIDRPVGVPTTKEVSRPVLKKRIPRR